MWTLYFTSAETPCHTQAFLPPSLQRLAAWGLEDNEGTPHQCRKPGGCTVCSGFPPAVLMALQIEPIHLLPLWDLGRVTSPSEYQSHARRIKWESVWKAWQSSLIHRRPRVIKVMIIISKGGWTGLEFSSLVEHWSSMSNNLRGRALTLGLITRPQNTL